MINVKNFSAVEVHKVATSGTSANIAFTDNAEVNSCNDILVINASSAVGYIKIGKGTQTATGTNGQREIPIGPNATYVLEKGSANNIAMKLDAAVTGVMYAAVGNGG